MKSARIDDELLALKSGALDPAMFPHLEHVRLGYAMLGRYEFSEASRYLCNCDRRRFCARRRSSSLLFLRGLSTSGGSTR